MSTLPYRSPRAPAALTELHYAAMTLLFFPALGTGLLGSWSLYQPLTGSPLGLIWPATLILLAFAVAFITALILIPRDARTATFIALPAISLALLFNLLALLSIVHDALYPDPRDPYPYEGLPEFTFWLSLSFLYFLGTLCCLIVVHRHCRRTGGYSSASFSNGSCGHQPTCP